MNSLLLAFYLSHFLGYQFSAYSEHLCAGFDCLCASVIWQYFTLGSHVYVLLLVETCMHVQLGVAGKLIMPLTKGWWEPKKNAFLFQPWGRQFQKAFPGLLRWPYSIRHQSPFLVANLIMHPCTGYISFCLHSPYIFLLLPRITSQTNYLHANLCFKLCSQRNPG